MSGIDRSNGVTNNTKSNKFGLAAVTMGSTSGSRVGFVVKYTLKKRKRVQCLLLDEPTKE